MRTRVFAPLAMAGALALAAGLWVAQHLRSDTGEIAPDIALTDLSGKIHHLSDYRGKLLLVNFWASWCAPCIDELPQLVEAQGRFAARGLQVIGPALDDAASVQPMAQRMHVNYPVMADYAQVEAALHALGDTQGALPFSVLIGVDGKIIKIVLGGFKKNELGLLIEQHLPPT